MHLLSIRIMIAIQVRYIGNISPRVTRDSL